MASDKMQKNSRKRQCISNSIQPFLESEGAVFTGTSRNRFVRRNGRKTAGVFNGRRKKKQVPNSALVSTRRNPDNVSAGEEPKLPRLSRLLCGGLQPEMRRQPPPETMSNQNRSRLHGNNRLPIEAKGCTVKLFSPINCMMPWALPWNLSLWRASALKSQRLLASCTPVEFVTSSDS